MSIACSNLNALQFKGDTVKHLRLNIYSHYLYICIFLTNTVFIIIIPRCAPVQSVALVFTFIVIHSCVQPCKPTEYPGITHCQYIQRSKFWLVQTVNLVFHLLYIAKNRCNRNCIVESFVLLDLLRLKALHTLNMKQLGSSDCNCKRFKWRGNSCH